MTHGIIKMACLQCKLHYDTDTKAFPNSKWTDVDISNFFYKGFSYGICKVCLNAQILKTLHGMKVLSIMQPWATLVALKEKRNETRSRTFNHRGDLAIHASMRIDNAACRSTPIAQVLYKNGIDSIDDLPTGAIIAISRLATSRKSVMDFGSYALMDDGSRVEGNEYAFGDYTEGRVALGLTDTQRIDPIPAKGQLGLWTYKNNNQEAT